MKNCSLWTLLLSTVLIVVLTRTIVVESGYCSGSQHKCANNRCIPKIWRCDEDDDCGDNSDEIGCKPKTCDPNTEFQCANNTMCIPSRWKCDQEPDCADESDESDELCQTQNCTADELSCGAGMECIPLAWKCDGQSDCGSQVDEDDCPPVTCESDEFKCNNGHCISVKWLCDQDNDCGDNSDESDSCGPPTCATTEFRCLNSSRCIPLHWKCDGDKDCNDGSDESGDNCPEHGQQCRSNEFQCLDSRLCIHEAWKCDGDFDCSDHSDEQGCAAVTCRAGEFQCANSNCIPGVLQCNKHDDCTDGSDEKDCLPAPKSCDIRTSFDCTGHGDCKDLSVVCNGMQECINGRDEDAKACRMKNHCNFGNGECSQLCLFDYNGTRCACQDGFKLDRPLGKTCVDVNECEEYPGLCSQQCENTKGGYKCYCRDGYSVDPENQHGCRMNRNNATIVFSNRLDVREVNVRFQNYTTVVNRTHSAVALDFDIKKSLYFWSDSAEEKIFIQTKGGQKEVLDISVSMPDGIAYDWIHGNLYWTDTGKDVIGVMNIESKVNRTLLDSSDTLDEPRSIVVDPIHGWMYWSDWGTLPRILKAGMDGKRMETIVSTNIMWPNGITIDYTSERLFWVDAKLHTIASSDLNGNNHYTVLTSMEKLQHPFAITVFEDFLYWTDWDLQSIQKVVKMNPRSDDRVLEVKPVLKDLYSPMDLHIFHPERQPEGENYCLDSPCAPNQFCLPAPYVTMRSQRFTCLCPDGSTNCNDGMPTKRPLVPSQKPTTASPNGSTSPGAEAATSSGFGVGTIAAIVSGVVFGVLVIAVIIGIVVYRSYSRRNVKSMNFDNPVYRKTTEDQFSLEKNQYQPASRLATHNTPHSNTQFQRLTQDEDSDPVV